MSSFFPSSMASFLELRSFVDQSENENSFCVIVGKRNHM